MSFKKNSVVDRMLEEGASLVMSSLVCSFDHPHGDSMNKIHKQNARERYAQFSAAVAALGYGQDVAFETILKRTRGYVNEWGTKRFKTKYIPRR